MSTSFIKNKTRCKACGRLCGKNIHSCISAIPLKERYLMRVEKTESCWLWKGCLFSNGYGSWKDNKKTPCRLAHRMSYELFRGTIPAGLMVCHHCDNRKCVNPDHLFLGSAKDNIRDMIRKGRAVYYERSGAKNPAAKLTWENVRDIRMVPRTRTLVQMGRDYGVSTHAIHMVIKNLTWHE